MNRPDFSVAIQGQEGSYHDQAALHYFGPYVPQYLDSFAEVFEAVDSRSADFGMVAVENSIVGSIAPVYDLLRVNDHLRITGEAFVHVSHSLIGLPGATLEDIRHIYSHPVALDQCRRFLDEEMQQATSHVANDTAGSAVFIRDEADPANAAIASANNAKRLGLKVLQSAVEDSPANYTRFLVLQHQSEVKPADRQKATKTSLLAERLTDDLDELVPGPLHKALGCYANNGVGITKIESRPKVGSPWRYRFYIDCAAGSDEPRMRKAREEVLALGGEWRELGTYQMGTIAPSL